MQRYRSRGFAICKCLWKAGDTRGICETIFQIIHLHEQKRWATKRTLTGSGRPAGLSRYTKPFTFSRLQILLLERECLRLEYVLHSNGFYFVHTNALVDREMSVDNGLNIFHSVFSEIFHQTTINCKRETLAVIVVSKRHLEKRFDSIPFTLPNFLTVHYCRRHNILLNHAMTVSIIGFSLSGCYFWCEWLIITRIIEFNIVFLLSRCQYIPFFIIQTKLSGVSSSFWK